MAIKSIDQQQDDIVAEINMTPLIDIMLVLLIIFMVTSSISLESGLDVTLPKTSHQTQGVAEQAVVVSMDKQGQISVQGKVVAWDHMKEEIAKSLQQEKTQQVVFEGDTESKLGHAIKVMDIAKEAGATQFALAAEEEEGQAPAQPPAP